MSIFHTRPGFTEVEGLPFPALYAALAAVEGGGPEELARALAATVDRETGRAIARQLASQRSFARETTSFHRDDDVARALRRAARVRVGPLRRSDVRAATPIVQLRPQGWRIAAAGACIECAALWEIQSNRSPQAGARVANARPLRNGVALSRDDLSRIAESLAATDGEARWVHGRYGEDETAIGRVSVAAACTRCARRPARSLRAAASPALAAARALRRLGIAKREAVSLSARGGPPIVQVAWGAAFFDPRRRGGFRARLHVQLGVGHDAEQRALVGRAEAVERATAMLREPDVRATPARALRQPYLPLEHWGLYAPEQYALAGFPFERVDEGTPLDWLWAEDASSGERLLVPAALTMSERLTTPRFIDGSSNGVATHVDRDAALRSALLEVVERDALQRAWYAGRGARPMAGASRRVPAEQRAYFESCGWALRFAWMRGRADLAVVAAVVERVVDDPPFPRGGTLLAAAAAGDPTEAIARAVREARMVVEAIGDGDARMREALAASPDLRRYWDVQELMDVTRLYLHPVMRPALRVLLAGAPTRGPARPVSDDARSVVARLERAGHRTLVIDLSSPHAAPFVTLQAVVLGTQPLAFGQGVLRLGTGLLPRQIPPREPPPPPPRFRLRAGTINPYILPLS